MVEERVMVLSAMATLVLRVIGDDGADVEELGDAVLAAYGPPPEGLDPGAVLDELLSTLSDAGLVDLREEGRTLSS